MQKDKKIKTCTKCNLDKPLSGFSKTKNSPDGYQWLCKTCLNAKAKQYREQRREKGLCVACGKNPSREERVTCTSCSTKHVKVCINLHNKRTEKKQCIRCSNKVAEGHRLCESCLEKARKAAKLRSLEFCNRVGNYFDNRCAICGEQSIDSEIFDCHHVDPDIKDSDISKMICKSWELIVIPELQKCVYLCRNCHARLHAGRFDADIQSGKLRLIPGKVIKEAA